MLNIVVPMAGAGSRFVAAGYVDPKPLVQLHGIPMIRLVIENLRPKQEHRFIFICQRAHIQTYDLAVKLKRWAPRSEVIPLEGLTEGAACTVLCAKSLIDNDTELMIANSDQYIDTDITQYLNAMHARNLDGQIMTMKANDPKWSFIKISNHGYVSAVVEKVVISDEATTGIYNFKAGRDFVRAAETMIHEGLRVNGEFYVAPTYNQLIQEGCKIGHYNIGSEGDGMYGLGTPADLDRFAALDMSRDVVASLPRDFGNRSPAASSHP
jgi:dTDP-glucose pyrophosphorylase